MPSRSLSTRFRPPRLRPGPSFSEALQKLRDGAVLRLEYDQGHPSWSLGDGQPVSVELVNLLLSCQGIEPDRDGLLDDVPAQTWRLRR